ncbi:MAG: ElyC/SanA/YdcF family protein, partial [Eubacteriales bacterium]|nr:ElyC/SanA/YdcF family protein [Eubacteriales bacterium]
PVKSMDNAVIQRFTDVIDTEITNTVGRFAESELRRMNIAFNELSLIRDKDGVSVWRVIIDTDSYVMKCFDKPEYRREITNYQLLNSLGVPTLKMIALTGCSLVMEDIERSEYRLGTPDDMNDPNTAEKIALWYRTLHQNGREYANNHDFIDEYDSLTLDNLRLIQEKTGTSGLPVWQVIEKHFDKIRSAVMELPRTLVYTDFYYTNLAVARDGRSALMFDYNFFYKSYVYSDIRNVCSSLGTDEVKSAFQSAYGGFDEREVMVDNVACELSSLVIACQRKDFPNWANDGLEKVKDGRLLAAVEKLLEGIWAQSITSSATRTCHMTNPIISAITEFIFVADEPKKSDAIFIPGGSFPELPKHAAQLYHMGLAPVLVPSGGLSVKLDKWPGVRSKKDIYNGNYQTDCEFYADVLIKCGAPGETILKEDKSGFTKENAAFSRKLCDENGLIVRRGIIVCKSFHARRCQMMYQLAFPEAELLICPVDCFDITRENWHTFEYGINRVLGELARCGNQMNDEIKGWLL